jgi:hypothetical protein
MKQHHTTDMEKEDQINTIILSRFKGVREKFDKEFHEKQEEYKKLGKEYTLTDTEKQELKNNMLVECEKALNGLPGKTDIVKRLVSNAKVAIEFYRDNVDVQPFQKHPSSMASELEAIDYRHTVEKITVKENRIFTQMQAPDSSRQGSFYTEGILPSDFDERAQSSGIGVKTTYHTPAPDKPLNNIKALFEDDPIGTQVEKVTKNVYPATTKKPTTFLSSTALLFEDTWSIQGETQTAKGGGAQFRVASKDGQNLERLDHFIQHSHNPPQTNTRLPTGFTTPRRGR